MIILSGLKQVLCTVELFFAKSAFMNFACSACGKGVPHLPFRKKCMYVQYVYGHHTNPCNITGP